MAKEVEKTAKKTAEEQDFKVNNMVDEGSIVDAAMEEMKKESDDKKKYEVKKAIAAATYRNVKTRAKLRARRREDDITKKELDGTKALLERLIGRECEIKDGKLIPTKNKCKEPGLTPTEYEAEQKKFKEEIAKLVRESDAEYNKDIQELRSSYESRYCSYWDY